MKRFAGRTDEKIMADLEKISDAKRRKAYFDGLVKEWDQLDKNNERRHNSHHHDFDISSIESSFDEDEAKHKVPIGVIEQCWESAIESHVFTEKAEYLHEIVYGAALSRILKNLTDCQKEVLYLRGVKLWGAEEICRLKNISSRAVRRHYELALGHIRGQLVPVIKLKRKLETDDMYRDIAVERFIFTTLNERKFVELSEGKYDGYYKGVVFFYRFFRFFFEVKKEPVL